MDRTPLAGDSSLAEDWRANYGQDRYEGMTAGMAHLAELRALRPGVDAARAADIIWAVLSLEIAGATLSPDEDPATLEGRRDEQKYRDASGHLFKGG